jgi:pimeloyl-ACP methyl ester carboxylesterase
MEVIELRLTNGDLLRGDFRAGDPSAPAVVFVHGFGGHRRGEKSVALAEACARRDWAFAAFDFRGHGESGGFMRELRGSRLLEDLDAVRAFLASRGVLRFGVVGSSMGGWAAVWFALRDPEAITGCVLLAPAFRFVQGHWERLTPAQRDAWQRTGVLRVKNEWVDAEIGYGIVEERNDFPPERLADVWAKPLLIFHGWADDVVPAADSLAFVARTKHPDVELRLLKAGDHRLTAFKELIAEEACRFFERSAD